MGDILSAVAIGTLSGIGLVCLIIAWGTLLATVFTLRSSLKEQGVSGVATRLIFGSFLPSALIALCVWGVSRFTEPAWGLATGVANIIGFMFGLTTVVRIIVAFEPSQNAAEPER